MPHFEGIVQIAYVVPDLRAAIDHWVSYLKVGPWFVVQHSPLTERRYRGEPTDLDTAIGLSYWNQINVELIQQLNDVPSVYRGLIDQGRYGFHHWGVATTDFEGDVQRHRDCGYDVVYSAVAKNGARLAFFDTTETLPGMIELIEVTDGFKAMFSAFHQATLGWDGQDPVRAR